MKALKSLGRIIEADCTVLARPDVKKEVERMSKDKQISVRAEVIDLFGKFILVQPDLTAKYYDMFKVGLFSRLLSQS
jgi:cohesin loading factor subunit SCC2